MALLDKISSVLKKKQDGLKGEVSKLEGIKEELERDIEQNRVTLDSKRVKNSGIQKEIDSKQMSIDEKKVELKHLKSEQIEFEKRKQVLFADVSTTATDITNKIAEASVKLASQMEFIKPAMSLDLKDISQTDFSKLSNETLSDDWRILMAWYATLQDPEKKIKFSEEELVKLGIHLIREILKRVKEKSMQHRFLPGKMKSSCNPLFEKIQRRLTERERDQIKEGWEVPGVGQFKDSALPGMYLGDRHGELAWEGTKKMIIQPRKYDILNQNFFLLGKDKVYGEIRIIDINEVDAETFNSNRECCHLITAEEQTRWGEEWREEPYYAYAFEWINKFKEPSAAHIPKEIESFATPGSFKFKDQYFPLPSPDDFESCVWIPDFISLEWSLAYQSREPNDIDLVVRASEDELGMYIYLDPSINLKIRRMFEKLYPGKPLDWVPSPFGPSHDFYSLFDLVLVPKPELQLSRINEPEFRERFYDAKDEKKLELFKFFKMLKPLVGRYKQEEYSIDSVVKVVKSRKIDWLGTGTFVEKKHDGIHLQVHSDGKGKVVIMTEEGNDITKKIPSLSEDLKKIQHSFIICGELELWENETYHPRQRTTALIHKKELDPLEKGVLLNVFDCLFWDGKDIHNESFKDRVLLLKAIKNSDNVKKGERKLATTEKELRAAIEYFTKQTGSEGAYLKLSDFKYNLSGATLENIKFKSTYSMDFKVLSVHKVEGAEAWNYLTTLEDGTPTGRSYNSSIKALPNEVIKIEFGELNRYRDSKTKKVWYNFWSGRVVEKRDKKTADNKATADKLVEASKGVDIEKKWPKRYQLDANPYMEYPTEDRKWKGMMQMDLRKKVIHCDFRYQLDSESIVTWTIFIPDGLSKVPETPEEAKKLLTKEILPIVEDTIADPLKKFNCIKSKEILAPGSVFKVGDLGAGPGKIQPRYMWTFDAFEVEHGCKKLDYVELFLNGGKYINGKVVFVKIKNKEEWLKTPEGIMTWMMFSTKDQTPYTLTKRAVDKKWIPPFNHSALPRKIRSQIPTKFKYWNVKDKGTRRTMRDELVKAIKDKRVNIKWEAGQ